MIRGTDLPAESACICVYQRLTDLFHRNHDYARVCKSAEFIQIRVPLGRRCQQRDAYSTEDGRVKIAYTRQETSTVISPLF